MQTIDASRKKILIVDDDQLLRQVLANDFVRRGYDVVEAGDGSQALKCIEQEKVDLVISDVRMPKIGGVELLTTIRQQHGEIPVFMFITGFSELTLEDAYHKGASALFPKPFNRKNFLKAVEWVLLPTIEKWREPVPRLSTDFEIEMILAKTSRSINGQMLNIGQGGMFVSMESPLPEVGETLEFKILFQQVSTIQLTGQGVVRWLRHQSTSGGLAGCGIEFLNLYENSVPEVIRLIEAFKPFAVMSEI